LDVDDDDVIVVLMQEAELNELRATIELLRQHGHAQHSPHRLSVTSAGTHKDLSTNGHLTLSYLLVQL